MSARDDFPWFVAQATPSERAVQYEAMCAEIDRLREANKLLNEICEDSLPSIVITERSIFRIDGKWMLVTPNPKDLT